MHPDNKSLILKPSEIAHHKMCVSPCALYVCQWEPLEMKKMLLTLVYSTSASANAPNVQCSAWAC